MQVLRSLWSLPHLPRSRHMPQVEIEDMEWNEDLQAFTFQCPCGDLFQISLDELAAGEEVARCPSCSLYVRVIYDPEDFACQA